MNKHIVKTHPVRNMDGHTPCRILRVSADERGPIVSFLSKKLNCSKRKAKILLDERRVFVNDRRVWMARHMLKAEDRVEIQAGVLPSREIAILYRDTQYIVANKEPGIVSIGRTSLESRLQEMLECPALSAVHRLDRDTSGCLWLADGETARDAAVQIFRKHEVRKRYRAIVAGKFSKENTTVNKPLDGKKAITTIHLLACTNIASVLSIDIHTGRTHQIRRHLATLGHPVLGDRQYATQRQENDYIRTIPRQMLHAHALSFLHPFTGRKVRCVAPIPRDFKACIQALDLQPKG